MADNSEKKSEIFEVGNKRGNLELTKIDERDTIEEFVKKVNDNFMNLAAHGGGPSGKDGKDGKDGVDGKDGKDSKTVEYIYALTKSEDDLPHFPTKRDERNKLFDDVENSSFSRTVYLETYWYDRALSISEKFPVEWIASRSKTSSSDEWNVFSAPAIWSKWGKNGSDGDGIEYIFKVTKRIEDKPETPKDCGVVEGKFFQDDDYVPTGWSDNAISVDPENKYEWVSIRKGNQGNWGKFSEPKLWSTYSSESFVSFAFVAMPLGADLNSTDFNYKPVSGDETTYENAVPDKFTYGGKDYKWVDAPISDLSTPVIWMTSATFVKDKPESYKSKDFWSTPKMMTDSSQFNVEWCTTDLDAKIVANMINAFNSGNYNFGTYMSAAGYDENDAENQFRDEMKETFHAEFTDNPKTDGFYMATTTYGNGKWSNWAFTRIKGDGVSSFIFDLSNEIYPLGIGDDLVLQTDKDIEVTTYLNAYYGTKPATINSIKNETNDTYISVVTNGPKDDNGYPIKFIIKNGANFKNPTTKVFTINVTASYAGKSSNGKVTFKIVGLKDGKDGNVYELLPSTSAIKQDKNGNYSPSKISCLKANGVDSSYVIKYKLNETGTTQNYESEITVNKDFGKGITFFLYDSKGNVVDQEFVPVIIDGKDGKNGKDGEKGDKGDPGSNGSEGKSYQRLYARYDDNWGQFKSYKMTTITPAKAPVASGNVSSGSISGTVKTGNDAVGTGTSYEQGTGTGTETGGIGGGIGGDIGGDIGGGVAEISPDIVFTSIDDKQHYVKPYDSPLGADKGHCIEVMIERYGYEGNWGSWSDPVVSSRQFSDDEVISKINEQLNQDTSELNEFVKNHTNEQLNSQLGNYATSGELDEKFGNYIESHAFEQFKSNAENRFASISNIVANTSRDYVKSSDGYLIYDDGKKSTYTEISQYLNRDTSDFLNFKIDDFLTIYFDDIVYNDKNKYNKTNWYAHEVLTYNHLYQMLSESNNGKHQIKNGRCLKIECKDDITIQIGFQMNTGSSSSDNGLIISSSAIESTPIENYNDSSDTISQILKQSDVYKLTGNLKPSEMGSKVFPIRGTYMSDGVFTINIDFKTGDRLYFTYVGGNSNTDIQNSNSDEVHDGYNYNISISPHFYKDLTVVSQGTLEKAVKIFKQELTTSEIATVNQMIEDGMSSTSIINKVKGDDGKSIVSAIFSEASKDGSLIQLVADKIKLDGKVIATALDSAKANLSEVTIGKLNGTIMENGIVTNSVYIDPTNFTLTRGNSYIQLEVLTGTYDGKKLNNMPSLVFYDGDKKYIFNPNSLIEYGTTKSDYNIAMAGEYGRPLRSSTDDYNKFINAMTNLFNFNFEKDATDIVNIIETYFYFDSSTSFKKVINGSDSMLYTINPLSSGYAQATDSEKSSLQPYLGKIYYSKPLKNVEGGIITSNNLTTCIELLANDKSNGPITGLYKFDYDYGSILNADKTDAQSSITDEDYTIIQNLYDSYRKNHNKIDHNQSVNIIPQTNALLISGETFECSISVCSMDDKSTSKTYKVNKYDYKITDNNTASTNQYYYEYVGYGIVKDDGSIVYILTKFYNSRY